MNLPTFLNKKVVTAGLILLVICVGVFVFFFKQTEEYIPQVVNEPEEAITVRHEVIGTSVEGRTIDAYTYGDGETHLLFVGGIHGGYEWNSVVLAYEMMDHFEENPELIPQNVSVTIVPSANPDGLFARVGIEGRITSLDVPAETISGEGRFNANDVDLNRNFDCKWQPESMWRGKVVSAGTAAFSEPEAQAIRDIVSATNPVVVVFWHSQANAVYASECEEGILSGTRAAMNVYATAAEYPAVDVFDSYPVTGDAEGWLASIGIPAITVELATHESTEWSRNLAGVIALIASYKGN
ncbi:hypothetical protein A2837_00855 [Candidatus Kaiserbacteria bacterium RIFCSPHIGHO2_01_FULL_46_22]|uniref:Peptidase M14 domain-containing protein n=1 Tax=Candidatus Kaiserbacteria bacterium RIFCSPHIGHO2_01_FULL_46_22 TaxID=1798475 RepID=A0A1F6BXW6_9BACT|nr:MAG: hypothetical protein A2837_00855 [Candidatus Kaiserbacteria bacterium RIFCSPHIGHO2_01_FULL_46_22]